MVVHAVIELSMSPPIRPFVVSVSFNHYVLKIVSEHSSAHADPTNGYRIT